VLVDVGRYKEARVQLEAIPALPLGDVLDPQYKRDAADLLERIRDKKDKT